MGRATDLLDALGIDAVCEAIGDNKPMTAIAEEAGVSIGSLLVWIQADPDRSARVRESRSVMARYWDERSEYVLLAATDEFELKKAKELGHHYRWRAKAIAPKEYGDRTTVAGDPEAPLVGMTEDALTARIQELLKP